MTESVFSVYEPDSPISAERLSSNRLPDVSNNLTEPAVPQKWGCCDEYRRTGFAIYRTYTDVSSFQEECIISRLYFSDT